MKATHGVRSTFHRPDGIKSQQTIVRHEDGLFQFMLETWWDGEDKEPTVTVFRLSPQSFDTLTSLMFELSTNRDQWTTIEKSSAED